MQLVLVLSNEWSEIGAQMTKRIKKDIEGTCNVSNNMNKVVVVVTMSTALH